MTFFKFIRGIKIPTSNRRMQKKTYHYLLPATNSLNWQGSDWETPTGLTFHQEVISSKNISVTSSITAELAADGIPPDRLIESIDEVVHSIARYLSNTDFVADYDTDCAIKINYNHLFDTIEFRSDVKVWPAVSGVTVNNAYKDVTY